VRGDVRSAEAAGCPAPGRAATNDAR